MDENQSYWERYGLWVDEDVESARKIGKYRGNAVVLPQDDPLIVEWNMYEELYD